MKTIGIFLMIIAFAISACTKVVEKKEVIILPEFEAISAMDRDSLKQIDSITFYVSGRGSKDSYTIHVTRKYGYELLRPRQTMNTRRGNIRKLNMCYGISVAFLLTQKSHPKMRSLLVERNNDQ